MGENAEDTGISTRELLRRLEKHNTELMEQSRTRHAMNNQLAKTYEESLKSVAESHKKSLDTVTESNRQMADVLRRSVETDKAVVILQHWAFGVDGKNGFRSKLENYESRMDARMEKQEVISARHSTLISKGMGGLGLLNIIIGIALAIWLRG